MELTIKPFKRRKNFLFRKNKHRIVKKRNKTKQTNKQTKKFNETKKVSWKGKELIVAEKIISDNKDVVEIVEFVQCVLRKCIS